MADIGPAVAFLSLHIEGERDRLFTIELWPDDLARLAFGSLARSETPGAYARRLLIEAASGEDPRTGGADGDAAALLLVVRTGRAWPAGIGPEDLTRLAEAAQRRGMNLGQFALDVLNKKRKVTCAACLARALGEVCPEMTVEPTKLEAMPSAALPCFDSFPSEDRRWTCPECGRLWLKRGALVVDEP